MGLFVFVMLTVFWNGAVCICNVNSVLLVVSVDLYCCVDPAYGLSEFIVFDQTASNIPDPSNVGLLLCASGHWWLRPYRAPWYWLHQRHPLCTKPDARAPGENCGTSQATQVRLLTKLNLIPCFVSKQWVLETVAVCILCFLVDMMALSSVFCVMFFWGCLFKNFFIVLYSEWIWLFYIEFIFYSALSLFTCTLEVFVKAHDGFFMECVYLQYSVQWKSEWWVMTVFSDFMYTA